MKRFINVLYLLICILSLSLIVSCKKDINYVVSFNTLGGSKIEDVSVRESSTITKPNDPTYGVNSFMGWYEDEDCTLSFDFTSEINSNVTLYAKWNRVLNIYSINDFHGAIEEKAAKVGEYLISNDSSNSENTIILSAGDMFQGSGISNYRYGLDMINIMNMIGFDAMSVGNHEFDWELNTILKYFDNDSSNGEANFPLLGCNVIDKTTNSLPVNMKAYQIIEKENIKIGVIGYIGSTLEDSIATDMVANYEFVDPVNIISDLSRDLRTNHNVDIVIALGHDASDDTNRMLANLSDESKIDAIINGHTHVRSSGTIRRSSDNTKVPYVQAGSSGEAIGQISLVLDCDDYKVENASSSTKLITTASKENKNINNYIEKILLETSDYFDKVIGVAGKNMTVYDGALWAANAIYDYCINNYTSCDVAFINSGGIRESGFPINVDENITIKKVYSIMPFDNVINMCTISGKILRNLIVNSGELRYSTDSVNMYGSNIYINGVLLSDDSTYRVAIVDYIFDKDTYPFKKGNDIYLTGVLLRDILIKNIEDSTKSGSKCFIGKE